MNCILSMGQCVSTVYSAVERVSACLGILYLLQSHVSKLLCASKDTAYIQLLHGERGRVKILKERTECKIHRAMALLPSDSSILFCVEFFLPLFFISLGRTSCIFSFCLAFFPLPLSPSLVSVCTFNLPSEDAMDRIQSREYWYRGGLAGLKDGRKFLSPLLWWAKDTLRLGCVI